MADIRPFKGIHYNTSLVKDLAGVICPPYDIISQAEREELYKRNEHNFIRLEYTRESPQDTQSDNKYTRAAADFERWLAEGVLKTDGRPALYLYDQHFTHEKKKYRRRSIIAAVKLEEWRKMVVRPHEDTLAAPKTDRLSLLWALQANTSPVLGMFEDPDQQIAAVLATQDKAAPLFSIGNRAEGHRVWAMDGASIARIRDNLVIRPLYIADGHHRYESALNYRNERRACAAPSAREEPFDFVMMTLVSFADPGLVILPTHRLVRGLPETTIQGLLPGLKEYFDIGEVPLDASSLGKRLDSLWAQESAEHPQLIVLGLAAGKLHVLRLRDTAAATKLMPSSRSEIYQRLNVSVLDHVILERLLDLTRDKEADMLAWTHDRQDAANRVLSDEYQLAFLVSPIKATAIKAIADISDRMPRKSTYFYPKLPSGLMVRRLV